MKLLFLYFIALLTFSCNNSETNIADIKNELSEPQKTLQSQLQELSDSIYSVKEKQEVDEFVDNLKKTEIIKTAIKKNDKAIDFTLPDTDGNIFNLKSACKKKPIVLTWYRGGWCTFCNVALRNYNKELKEIIKRNAEFIVLTPEVRDSSIKTKQKQKLDFKILNDSHNQVAKKYGIAFPLEEKVKPAYKKYIKLQEYNDDDEFILPFAATYIIDTKGVVRYSFINEDYRKRANPKEILKVLDNL